MTHMRRVGVREMRQNLSRFLQQVEDGASFEITDRGRPVARLVPSPEHAGALARLVQRHGVQPPARLRTRWPKPLVPPAGSPSSGDLLDAERAERL
jgi:prevent-host-death family protein